MLAHLSNYAKLAPIGLAYQAEKQVRMAICRAPHITESWLALASTLFSQGRFSEAIEAATLYKELGGESVEWHLLMGRSYAALGLHNTADPYYQAAAQLFSSPTDGTLDLSAHVKEDVTKVAGVVDATDSVASANPRVSATAIWECALQDLIMGRFEDGWRGYEYRLVVHSRDFLHMYPFDLPLWDGRFLDGGSLLIHGEQGLGDEVMFARHIPLIVTLAKACKMKLYLAVTTPLLALFQESFPDVVCLEHRRGDGDVLNWAQGYKPQWLGSLPKNTVHCPSGSLTYLLDGRTCSPSTYLRPIKKDVEFFKDKLKKNTATNDSKKIKVGLAWGANLRTHFGREKSIDLALFETFSKRSDIALVGIQGPEYGGIAKELPNVNMLDLHQHLDGMDKVAGLIANLDAVISIDTSYAHLAGAMGKPCHVLLKKNHDWRFGQKKTANHIYTNMTLHRQVTLGDWPTLISNLCKQPFAQGGSL
jgi:hypothetical protein